MGRRSYQITLDEAIPGMILADDLLDQHGKVLLPAGSTLTETSLVSLGRRGVDMLPILREESTEPDNEADLEKHRRRLGVLFRKHTEDDMATEILRQFVTNFRLGVHQ